MDQTEEPVNSSNSSVLCRECTGGLQCEVMYSYFSFLVSSLMSVDILSATTADQKQGYLFLYTFVTVFFVFVAIVNNVICIETCLSSPKIRITNCGMYMLFYSIYSLIGMCFMAVTTITTLFFNDQLLSHSVLHCRFLPVCVNILFLGSLWTSSFLAVERMLIECFNFRYSLYRTRRYSIVSSVFLLLVLSLINVSRILGSQTVANPVDGNYHVCVFGNHPSFAWKMADQISHHAYLHYGVPLLLHLSSTILLLRHIAAHKIYVSCLTKSHWPIICLQQVRSHKEFFIPPLLIILCTIPRFLVQELLEQCAQSSMKFYWKFHILLAMFNYASQIVTCFIYIYPSRIYRRQYYDTHAYRVIHWITSKLCCCFRVGC
jgi:hypothetical protein